MALPHVRKEEDVWSPTADTGEKTLTPKKETELKLLLTRWGQKMEELPKQKSSIDEGGHRKRRSLFGTLFLVSIVAASAFAGREFEFGQRAWTGESPGERSAAVQKSSELNSELASEGELRAQLQDYEQRVVHLRRLRDRLATDSPQYVDLDKNVTELDKKLVQARQDLVRIEADGVSPAADMTHVRLEQRMAGIRQQLQSMEAE